MTIYILVALSASFVTIYGNPLDQPLPLNSDFWEKKSQYYSHGTSSDEDVRLAEEVVAHRLQLKHDDKSRRLEAQLELIAPVVDKAERKWAELVDDVDHLNFTAIEWEIENELPEPNDRTWRKGRERGRGARGLPAFLGNAVKLFDLKQVVKELETSVMTSVSCSACKAGVGLLQHYVDSGKSTDEIVHASTKLCMSLKIESRRVCEGIILAMADEVVFVLSRLILTADEICGFVIGDVCAIPYNPYHDWEVALPPIPKPALISQQMPNGGVSSPPLKVLHLSDTHFDPYYHEGSTANCNEPLCCRLTDGIPDSPTNGAGRWGDYRKCDTPRHTIESMLQHIANYHQDIDFIIWTGDLPPHDVWNQTRNDNLYVLRETVRQLTFYFPNTRIFPALGNHESAPVNSFPPPNIEATHTMDWLYDELDLLWRRWLPDSTSPTVRKGAFYSVLVSPGFRMLSLNMNYCNNKNWWLLLNSTDPAQELQWLVYELQSAELKGEKVHILGHIPPGHSDCLKVWSHNYYRIVNRYEATISGQFFGHTHFDEYEVFYDEVYRGRASSIAYIGPSVTPYYGLNPGYRIYHVDGNYAGTSRMVVDHETWIMDLQEANRHNVDSPRWYRLYTAREAFRMPSLTPQDWDHLVHRMTYDDNLFQTYYKYYWKASPVRPSCDADCKKRLLCDLKSGRSNDRKLTCQEIEERIDSTKKSSSWKTWLFNGFAISSVFTFLGGFGWLGDSVGSFF
ncbi:sphingomyelin phosphodiesterase-like isoform X1 [Daphnia pulicaria]|uniref:sphingomyelin phosphodiesterase-like isoform X1 n=1 Tax=Daphnia pulicaria TaxID=35523 RepID=UPI001EEB9C00|nr:sphingomyelin phosphodiesterase-like isoform X1 [Daphnia pulicaria]XP_046643242.1 sphingomyelin phosphodiesterase-like isoform X1 [Daphnia pulicaria]XP_046643243.1 sphingomyelin phosphodiesterase-like isoform X1 [Daphnia pulicaria]